MKKNVWHTIEQRTMTHPLTSGIHDSKHAYVPKADRHFKHMTEINMCRKKQRHNMLREYLP